MPYFISSAGLGSCSRCRRLGSIKGRHFSTSCACRDRVVLLLSSFCPSDGCLCLRTVEHPGVYFQVVVAHIYCRPDQSESKRRTLHILGLFFFFKSPTHNWPRVSESAENWHGTVDSTWNRRHRFCQQYNGHYWKYFHTSKYRHLISRRLDATIFYDDPETGDITDSLFSSDLLS